MEKTSLFSGFNMDSLNSESKGIEVDIADSTSSMEDSNTQTIDEGSNEPVVNNDNKDKKNLIEVDVNTGDDENEVDPSLKDPKKNPSREESSSPFTSLASALREEGILPNFNKEDFDGSGASLMKAVENEILANVNSYKDSLPIEIKNLIENYEEGVPLDRYISVKSRETELYSITEEVLEENEDLQKNIVGDYLASKGFKPEKIKKTIDRFIDSNELVDEAKDALAELKELKQIEITNLKEKTKLDRRNADLANTKALTDIKTTIDKKEEIIPGIKLNKAVRDKIYNSMTTPIRYSEEGVPVSRISDIRAKDPIQFEMTLHYLAELGVFEGDWSRIKGATKTSAIKELEEKLKSTSSFGGGNTIHREVESKSKDILSSMKNIKY